MPHGFKYDYSFLFLKQYYLLNKAFNLNTQRIVNFRVRQGKEIYLYNAKGDILKASLYIFRSLN